ncbi:sigma-54-dependent Fis family transcriptional regulator [Clostridium sp. HV4-5-A1G]|uniref:sigma-54-dependent Fis family transcriptional regulator n=1 Tax=Clostridium sp. HV4-5-A1G TaxID=2004595 RepID=UPI0022A72EA3|nr:sigma 54-interacting transcriptional regulator [Clostridium sp. HV4-5-A1G]
MKTLYNFVKGSNFLIILSDEDGYLLKVIGDPNILAMAEDNVLIEGSNRSEKKLGTNGIGTCLYLKEPIQVWADEHFYILHSNWVCSGAPIINENGKLLGSLCITGTWDKVHIHTLGMVVSGAAAISKQMDLQNAYYKLIEVKNQLDIMVESLKSGAILINNGIIIKVNSLACQILRINEKDLLNSSIINIISEIDFKKSKKNIYSKEINIGKNHKVKVSLTSIIVQKSNIKNSSEFLLTFEEIKNVHKLVTKTVGSNAHFFFDDIIGNSQPIIISKRLGKIASENNANVLLIGDSGTGKELFAQSIHNSSTYSTGPFIDINCGAIPKSLIESELFGYESGAFTGARREGCAGKFELANGGTIFLDEIGDMPYDVQAALLRVIQNREVFRIGGKTPIKIDVRIIAATNKDLEQSILNNTFRRDLYYRLNVFNIKIPPLAERGNDIILLADYFVKKYKLRANKIITGIDKNVYDALMSYHWPGNVRELENTIERAILVAQTNVITINDLPDNIIANTKTNKKTININNNYIGDSLPNKTLNKVEINLINNALKTNNGNIKKTAESIGMSRRTLYRKLDKYKIDYKLMRINK